MLSPSFPSPCGAGSGVFGPQLAIKSLCRGIGLGVSSASRKAADRTVGSALGFKASRFVWLMQVRKLKYQPQDVAVAPLTTCSGGTINNG
ncbi:MAG: hypothetical protein WD360_04230, partial [Nitriliruptoraceae bacterium]